MAKTPRISVVIPSLGRPSLLKTLQSLESQVEQEDQVIVVFDGWPDAFLLRDIKHYRPTVIIHPSGPSNDWGATPRTIGQKHAAGDILMWMDDDDWYNPGALDVIRKHYADGRSSITVFGMTGVPATVVECGKISTQMFAISSNFTLGKWGTEYAGDYEFISSTIAANPGIQVDILNHELVHYSGQSASRT